MSNNKVPQCVGFIMDGNRRFALEQGLASIHGHSAGEAVFVEVAQWVKDMGISHAVFYAFSTENWSRSTEEVAYLQTLFLQFIKNAIKEIHERKFCVRVIGSLHDFQPEIIDCVKELESISSVYSETTIWIALSYGGRAEIVAAVNQAITSGIAVTEADFSQLLSTAGMPDPDLIIRTGGAMRLSNFLPWQSVYSELMFTQTYWPAFTKAEFTRMLAEYADRQRRFGT